MEYYAAIKKDVILTRLDLEGVRLSEIGQAQKRNATWSLSNVESKIIELIDTEVKTVAVSLFESGIEDAHSYPAWIWDQGCPPMVRHPSRALPWIGSLIPPWPLGFLGPHGRPLSVLWNPTLPLPLCPAPGGPWDSVHLPGFHPTFSLPRPFL